jgi:hypothetical protein
MMTIPQLRALMGQQIGLPASFDGSVDAYRGLSRENQIALTQAMIAYIRQNPGSFTPGQVQTAEVEAPRAATMTPADESFDVGAFFQELENNAINTVGAPLVSVGQGVSEAIKLIGTLIPIAVLVAVFVFAFPHIKKATTTTAP